MTDEARAAEEIAKSVGTAIDAGREFGKFIAPYIRRPLEQAIGIFEDKLKYMRWERQVRLMVRSKDFLRELGLEAPTRAVPMKIVIPLLLAASLEDDDELQDVWARLLVNAGDADRKIEIRRLHISILEDLGTLEVQIINTVYSTVGERLWQGIWTHELPEALAAHGPKGDDHRPAPDVQLALGNLIRLQCLSSASTYGGADSLLFVYPTVLGKSLYDACTLRTKQ